MVNPPPAILIDARTSPEIIATLRAELESAKLVGIDCETQDENRHAGLNIYNNAKRHVFDHRRTVMTGFSLYTDDSVNSYYFNLAQADVENRLTQEKALEILGWISNEAVLVAHNASFEYVMFESCHNLILENVVCTMQLAVSHHSPDEYDLAKFQKAPLVGLAPFVTDIRKAYHKYEPDNRGQNLTGPQAEILGKFIAKESTAAQSYNGHVAGVAYGYGLKQLVERLYGFKMTTYKQTLEAHSATHMGELTGEQVCNYGADDAFWAVQVYKTLSQDMMRNNPKGFITFLQTENSMVRVYADAWRDGVRVDLKQVYQRRDDERIAMATKLRETKQVLQDLLPFNEDPNAELSNAEKWYDKAYKAKRRQIVNWALSPDHVDDYDQCSQVSNPIGNAWTIEKGNKPAKNVLNLTHYYAMRILMYDLLEHSVLKQKGKVQSDAEARGRVRMTFEAQATAGDKTAAKKVQLLQILQDMSEIEQRMKLYLTPYTQLMDPETGRVYPSLSSRLATRRMAASFPNYMQLAKSGNSTYIRGFYLAEDDDHLVVSADWSSVELVLVGDASNDPGFREVFGQLPYGDLHSGAAADGLAVKHHPGLTEEEFSTFKRGENPEKRDLRHLKTGVEMSPKDFHKMARTTIGKASNFNYWFSGALSTVGIALGWSSDEMWEAVDRYRQRFPAAEQWRVNLQIEAVRNGFVELPDHHRRVRWEATPHWAAAMKRKFSDLDSSPAMGHYADLALKRIQSRAKNQVVNARIQGTCATLAKRSILRLDSALQEAGIDHLVRFMMPIHDELVYSVHKSVVMQFIPMLRKAMCDHLDIVSNFPLDCTVALGRTFKPFDGTPMSQWELDEASPVDGVIPVDFAGKKLPDHIVQDVVTHMMKAA